MLTMHAHLISRRAAAALGTASFALASARSEPRAPLATAAAAAPALPPAARRKYRVGVLGATGAVGQRFVEALDAHPWFELTALGASERSVGKPYADAAHWLLTSDAPARVRAARVVACEPAAMPDVDFVFSALDTAQVRGGGAARHVF
jgi:hypothetical protein